MHQGGFLGIGGYRVLGIGLPLLQNFNISEVTSILAHEFGHFYGGDF
jgi:Zn-dependent protease with chaperone function